MMTTLLVVGANFSEEGCHYEKTTSNNPRHEEIQNLCTSVENIENFNEAVLIQFI